MRVPLLAAVGLMTAVLLTSGASAETLRVAVATPALTLDPHATSGSVATAYFRQMYDTLIGLDDDMNIVPSIATAWEFDGDRTWRFHLRDDVVFHDGSKMTAEDVAFSIIRESGSAYYRDLFGGIEDAVVVDETTVDVISGVGDPILPQRMQRLFIMSKAWLEANDVVEIPGLTATGSEAYSLRHANGTGPLKLVSHDSSTRTVLTRNTEYWGETTGNYDDFVLELITAAPTRLAGLLSGEVDMIMEVPLQDLDRVKASPGFVIGQVPRVNWVQLELDGTRDVALEVYDKAGNPLQANPLKDVRVRRAFAHAIDAQLIVDRVMRGYARPVGIPSVPGVTGYQPQIDERPATDIDLAKQLLAEAGYPDGFQVQLNCPLEIIANSEEICRAVANMLARIGVDVRVKDMLWADFAALLVNGPDSSFHLIDAGPNSGNAQDTFIAVLMTRDLENNTGQFNWALWSNERVDEIGAELTHTFDEDERNKLFEEGFTIARDDVHAVYLHQPMLTWATSENIEVKVQPDATPLLYQAHFAE